MTEADALRTEIAGLVGALQGSRESVDSLRADLATVAAALTDERAKSAESERDYQNEHKAHADTKAALAESREQTKSALALGNHALEASRAETAAAQARIAELESERDTWRRACDRDTKAAMAAEAALAALRERVEKATSVLSERRVLNPVSQTARALEALRG